MNRILSRMTPLVLLLLQGCHQAHSPETVNADVSNARRSASEQSARATREEQKAESDARRTENDAERKVAQANYDASVADAEGRHKVAIAKCEALSSDAQKACTDQADAALATAKANAEAQRVRER